MAYVCENCGKGLTFGRSSSHGRGVAGKRWKKRAQKTSRTFKPNLQRISGMLLCTDCISKLKLRKSLFKKQGRLGSRLQIASL